MKKLSVIILMTLIPSIFLLSKCNTDNNSEQSSPDKKMPVGEASYNGYNSREEWGHHIVIIAGCNDCHTPKKMTATGPEPNMDLELSGHSAAMPVAAVNRQELEKNGAFASNDLTAWIGPWGISYAANITSDSTTGVGNWSEEQFITCLRKGKYMGLENARNLLPPMPWQDFRAMTDDELKAVFAYLKSTKPIHNIVPQAEPPLMAQKQ